MKYSNFVKKIDKIHDHNADLIEKYETRCNESFDDCIPDLYQLYCNLANIQSNADPISSVLSALYNSVQTGVSILDSFNSLISQAQLGGQDKTILQRYFNDIGKVYDKNGNDYNIEYNESNADKLIEMNLKTVVSIAKGYQGLGLSLEELISAGNMGLVVCAKGDEKTHTSKYDPQRAKLKENILSTLEELPEDASEQQILEKMNQYMTYGDVKKKFLREFAVIESSKERPMKGLDRDDVETEDIIEIIKKDPKDIKVLSWNKFTKADVINWVLKNVKNASFSSVAFLWIRAYILIAIDTESRLVKKPKSEIHRDRCDKGSYQKEITIDIDAPATDDGNTTIGDMMSMEDDSQNALDVSESYDIYKENLNKLLDGVKPRDRSVFLKKFGIGLPRPMLPKEIAEQENLSIARISQIFQTVVEQMQMNQVKYNIDLKTLFNEASNLN